jgi:acylphosphatase
MSRAESRRAAEILVESQVQGVGYRYFVQRQASRLNLTGYAMNLPDGRVGVRVEGTQESTEELVSELEKGPPLARVEKVTLTWLPPSGRFATFGIRFAEFEE